MRSNLTWSGLALTALLALAGCGKKPASTTTPCGPSTCVGCCDASGACQPPEPGHCGIRGAACQACGSGQECNSGVCQAGPAGSSSGASSGSAGSSGATSGSASSSGGTSGSTGSAGSTGASGSSGTTSGPTGSVGSSGTSSGPTGSTGTSGSVGGSSGGTTGAPGTAVVSPSALDFRGVALNAPQQRDLTVTNAGAPGTQLTITAVDVVPGANTTAADFTAQVAPGSPSALGAGQRADVVVTATAAAVGPKAATVVIHTNDPTTPTWQIPVQVTVQQQPACQYAVSPTTVDFGRAEPNATASATFRITNTSANSLETCRIADVDLAWVSVGGAFAVKNAPIDATLAAGSFLDVTVTFAPTTPGATYDGDVRFFTSSTSQPQASVHLHGAALTTCLQVSPASVDLGTIQQGCASRPSGLVISNVCSLSTEHLASVALSPVCADGGACPFALSGAPAGAFDLLPGQNLVVDLTFQPGAVGGQSADVTVTAQGEQPVVVPVSGQGAATASQTDTFLPPTSNKVDVLLVVDDSGSMSDKQAALGANFGAFIQPALDAGVDFHLAVTTTTTLLDNPGNCTGASGFISSAPCGELNPADGSRPQVLNPQTPNLAAVFAQNVNVGTNGSSIEMGLEGAYEALSGANLAGPNAAFLRPDARLAVVVVSDASDQSARPLDYYFNYFLNLKAGAPSPGFTLSAITSTATVAPPGSCAYDGTNVIPNPYIELAQLTGGAIEEICSGNWAQMMGEVGAVTFGSAPTISRLPLSHAADPASAFSVTVDGSNLPAALADGGTAWSYDANGNSIDFGATQPRSSSTVVVTYDRACAPPPLGSYDGGAGTSGTSGSLSAGEGGYTVSLLGGAGYSPLAGTPVPFPTGDSSIVPVTLPPGFDFRFYGQPVDTVYVDTNGFVGFDPALLTLCGTGFTCDLNNTLPAQANSPNASVYLWWMDLNVTDGGQVVTGLESVGGEQVFAVDYQGVSFYGDPSEQISARLRLYPASSRMEVLYGPQTNPASTVFGGAVVGVQNGASGAQAEYTAGLACSTASTACTPAAWPAQNSLTYDYLGNALFGAGEFTVRSASTSGAGGAVDVYLYEGNDAPGCAATTLSGSILHLGLAGVADAGTSYDVDAGTAHLELLALFPDGGQGNTPVTAGVVQVDALQPDGGLNGRFSAAVALPDGGLGELHGTFFAPSCH